MTICMARERSRNSGTSGMQQPPSPSPCCSAPYSSSKTLTREELVGERVLGGGRAPEQLVAEHPLAVARPRRRVGVAERLAPGGEEHRQRRLDLRQRGGLVEVGVGGYEVLGGAGRIRAGGGIALAQRAHEPAHHAAVVAQRRRP